MAPVLLHQCDTEKWAQRNATSLIPKEFFKCPPSFTVNSHYAVLRVAARWGQLQLKEQKAVVIEFGIQEKIKTVVIKTVFFGGGAEMMVCRCERHLREIQNDE